MTRKIICVCPTHGRAYNVEEAVDSFTRQLPTECEHELLIVSDCPEQRLTCSVNGVRVVNQPVMHDDISAKFNAALDLCDCDYVAWWDDDDISLPFRLRYSLRWVDLMGVGIYKQSRAWFWNDGHLDSSRPVNLFFGSALFRRDCWLGSEIGAPPDKTAWERMTNRYESVDHFPKVDETYFIYRWGGTGPHDSEVRGTNADRFKAFRRAVKADPRFMAGEIELGARRHADYGAQVQRAIKEGAGDWL